MKRTCLNCNRMNSDDHVCDVCNYQKHWHPKDEKVEKYAEKTCIDCIDKYIKKNDIVKKLEDRIKELESHKETYKIGDIIEVSKSEWPRMWVKFKILQYTFYRTTTVCLMNVGCDSVSSKCVEIKDKERVTWSEVDRLVKLTLGSGRKWRKIRSEA